MSHLWKKCMNEKWPIILLSLFEVWLITDEVHQVKWECDACEGSEDTMKAPESFFLEETIAGVSWKQRPLRPCTNDSELHWLGLGNWVNQPTVQQFTQYNDLNGTWFTQFPNPNQ